ncbi:MAG: hypothetical protein RI897_2045 [Verrucomicrobiota bacterium]
MDGEVPREVMGVDVVFAVLELLCPCIVCITQVIRDGLGRVFADFVEGCIDGFDDAVAFGGGGYVEGGLSDGYTGFGPADEFGGLEGGGGEDEGGGVGEADVFCCVYDDAAGDESGIFAGVDHFGEPVEGGIWVASAHGFDEGGDCIVVGVTVGAIDHGLFLDTFLGDFESEVDEVVLRRGWGGESGDFEGVQGFSGIAVGEFSEV